MSLSDRPLCEHGRTSREGCVRCDETSVVLTEAGKEALKEAPSLFIMVHQRCAKPDDIVFDDEGMTRRAYDAIQVKKAERRRARNVGAKPFNARKAWWCHRCGDRVKQSDIVVGVKVRS